MSFSQRFFKNVEVLLTNPTPRQEERMAFAQRFYNGLQMITRAAFIDGYARGLDYDQIDVEELMWLYNEIGELPNPDSEVNDYNGPMDMPILRDQVARCLFTNTLKQEEIISLPAQRKIESFF